MFGLIEKIINELKYNELIAKQKTITNLFPPFASRVKKVAGNGGVRLVDVRGNIWNFTVSSGTEAGKKYDVVVRFKGLKQKIKDVVKDKTLWKSDMSGVDLRKLASKLFYELDLDISCSDPSFLYWGFAYLTTKNQAKFGSDEKRPPKKRNPKEHGFFCKHIQLVMEVLPTYLSTFSKYLDRFYGKDIKQAEEEIKKDLKKEEPKKELESEKEETKEKE